MSTAGRTISAKHAHTTLELSMVRRTLVQFNQVDTGQVRQPHYRYPTLHLSVDDVLNQARVFAALLGYQDIPNLPNERTS
jgi:hypothetical protein